MRRFTIFRLIAILLVIVAVAVPAAGAILHFTARPTREVTAHLVSSSLEKTVEYRNDKRFHRTYYHCHWRYTVDGMTFDHHNTLSAEPAQTRTFRVYADEPSAMATPHGLALLLGCPVISGILLMVARNFEKEHRKRWF
ncbi:MAG: hypothetical protein IJ343_01015 [Clostridia bacterium]|nr:hypothetical protein [Clostridia bacterium]